MKNLLHKIISLGLAFVMLFSMTATALAASNNSYVEGTPENIVVSFNQLSDSTYKVTIRNDRENAIGDWSLSFKTNFKLSEPEGADWSISSNNTYTFTDPENGSIAAGGSFSFTVESSKKKNSEIHNVNFKYEDVAEHDDWQAYTKDTDGDGLPDWIENVLGTDALKADTDEDGLTDYDEYTTVLTDPLKRDSVGKGYGDAEYDFDSDGLTNIEEVLIGSNPYKEDADEDGLVDADEQSCGTNPNDSDTDDDGMVDGAEKKYNMNPTNPDTLGDGVLDGDRLFDIVQENRDAFEEYGITTSVTIQLKGNQIHTLSVEKVDITDPFLSDQVPGFLGNAFEYNVEGEFDSAEISFEFPERLLSDVNFDPAIFYFDEEAQLLIPLENQILSRNKISAKIMHFSKYILLNWTEYADVWKYEIKYDETADSFKNIDVAFVIDSSGSMATNDKADVRKEVTKKFIDKLSANDRGAVIDFDYFAKVYSDFSSDKTVLFAAVDAYSVRTAHPFRRNGAPFRFKLSKAQQVD